MDCRTAQQLITGAITDELNDETREALRTHCADCASCRDEWDALRSLWRRMGRWKAPARSADLSARFANRLAANEGPSGSGPRARTWMIAAVMAALLATGATGFGVGRWTAPAGPEADPLAAAYLLLLYGEADAPGKTEVELIAEYAEWARELNGQGRLVDAHRLLDPVAWVEPGEQGATVTPVTRVGPDAASGFFLIHAEDIASALDLARQGPHARYGGRIEVRQVAR